MRKFSEKERLVIAKKQGRDPKTFEPVEYTCPECGKVEILDAWEVSIIESDLLNSRYVCNECFKKLKGGKK